jgi:hypothetical protein
MNDKNLKHPPESAPSNTFNWLIAKALEAAAREGLSVKVTVKPINKYADLRHHIKA